jgi:hypothetical protein
MIIILVTQRYRQRDRYYQLKLLASILSNVLTYRTASEMSEYRHVTYFLGTQTAYVISRIRPLRWCNLADPSEQSPDITCSNCNENKWK